MIPSTSVDGVELSDGQLALHLNTGDQVNCCLIDRDESPAQSDRNLRKL